MIALIKIFFITNLVVPNLIPPVFQAEALAHVIVLFANVSDFIVEHVQDHVLEIEVANSDGFYLECSVN